MPRTPKGACKAPSYEPEKWNNDDNIKRINNCYNYACDKRIEKGSKAQPGKASGLWPCSVYYLRLYDLHIGDTIIDEGRSYRLIGVDCSQITEAALKDGLKSVSRDETCIDGHKVALAINPGIDYHWYRLDDNGYWSHKYGEDDVIGYDDSEHSITDPENADRGEYTEFCGYFCVDRNIIKIE